MARPRDARSRGTRARSTATAQQREAQRPRASAAESARASVSERESERESERARGLRECDTVHGARRAVTGLGARDHTPSAGLDHLPRQRRRGRAARAPSRLWVRVSWLCGLGSSRTAAIAADVKHHLIDPPRAEVKSPRKIVCYYVWGMKGALVAAATATTAAIAHARATLRIASLRASACSTSIIVAGGEPGTAPRSAQGGRARAEACPRRQRPRAQPQVSTYFDDGVAARDRGASPDPLACRRAQD